MQIYNKTTDTTHPPIQRILPATPVLTPTLHKVKLAVHSFTQTYKYTKLNSTLQKISIFHCYTITFAYICHTNHLFNTLPIIYMSTPGNHFSKIPSQSTAISFLKEIDTNIYISANCLSKMNAHFQTMSAASQTMSSAHQTMSPAHQTMNAAHQTMSAAHQTMSAASQTMNAARQTMSAASQTMNAARQTMSAVRQTMNAASV